jgi:magnesium-transporting ATPase (P-type)
VARPAVEAALVGGGLAEAEAEARARAGQANVTAERASRTVADILRANLFTRFNAVLGVLFVAVLVVGPPQDALFGLVLVVNTAIGVLQELRAKRTLDRLSILTESCAAVLRSGRVRSIPASQVVVGDLLQVGAGDQVIVDGRVAEADGLEVNEALLTGESAPVSKPAGSDLLSGSYVSAGGGWYSADRVGEACYARTLAREGRRFQLVRSELVAGINRILGLITWALVPLAILQIAVQLRVHPALPDAIRASAAGIVTLVPEGLFLLTSVSLAVAVVRLGRRRVLAQQLAAVEMLARVDVVCLDKTGTLTDGTVALERVVPLEAAGEATQALAALARLDPRPDETLRAVARALPPPGWSAVGVVPFSSERRWSAASFADHGTWALGAPEVLLGGQPDRGRVREQAGALMREGSRVLLLVRAQRASADESLPPGVTPAALIALRERLRPDAAPTLAYLARQRVAVKVLSGDHPATVAAAGRSLGLGGGGAVDGTALRPDAGAALDQVVDGASVFGRVGPQQKQAVVRRLRALGHTVAMVGDGVNDVLAMKAADIAIAMGRGSAAARAAAPLVLLDSSFAQVPQVVGEGRRVIGNIERLADLFVTKTVYAMLLIVAVSAAVLPFPFFPRHLTLVGAFTIGIPSVFLALAPNRSRVRPGFLRRVARFTVPAGVAAGAASFAAYFIALQDPAVSVPEARTSAVLVLSLAALWILLRVARPLTAPRLALVTAMAGGLALAFLLPTARAVFALELPPPIVWMAGLGVATVAVVALEAAFWVLRLMKGGAEPR